MTIQTTLKQENDGEGSVGKIRKFLLICLLNIAGVDHERLKDAPKSERVVYPALGVLMCLAASWTGFGLTMKFKVGLDLGWLGATAVFFFTMIFALLLEMVVVGTLKNGTKILGNLGVRILLGINLMLLQVVPVLVFVFAPNIEVYKNEQVIQKTLDAKEAVSKATDLTTLTRLNESAQERFSRAKANRLNPPENMAITETSKSLDEKVSELEETEKKLESQKMVLAVAKSKLAAIPKDKDKEKENAKALAIAQRNLNNAQYKFNETNSAFEKLTAEKEELQAKKEKLVTEYDESLTKELNEATAILNQKSAQLNSAMNEVQKVTQETQNLAQQASASRFFNDVSSLIELMKHNDSILYTSIFIVFIAMLIDLMPIITKLQLSKGVYAKLVGDEEEISKALAELKKTQILSDVERKRVEYEKLQVTLEQERLQLQEMQSEILSKKMDNDKILKDMLKAKKKENSFFGKFFGGSSTKKEQPKKESIQISDIAQEIEMAQEDFITTKEQKS